MNAPLVKICGITGAADAILCREAGADWLGLVFAGGPRQVDPERAAAIRRAVPDAVVVGVFLDAPLEVVLATAATARLDLLQLHGREPAGYRAELRARSGLPLIRAVPAEDVGEVAGEADGYLLFDRPKLHGAPAAPADGWTAEDDLLHARAAAAVRAGRRVVLAGGLHPGNVGEAIARVRPCAVDVARGVERAPGVKDAAAVREFVAEVRRTAAPREVRHVRV